MEQVKIDRINELARKSKTEAGLTPEEKEEQAALRQEYVAAVRANLTEAEKTAALNLNRILIDNSTMIRHNVRVFQLL